MKEITSNIYYVGVNDRNKTLFEGLWPLPNGVSYNSYLIVDEKVCLVDTVEVDFFVQYLENIREVIGERPIDYLVVNHMEPDHSGALALLRQFYHFRQVQAAIGILYGHFFEVPEETHSQVAYLVTFLKTGLQGIVHLSLLRFVNSQPQCLRALAEQCIA